MLSFRKTSSRQLVNRGNHVCSTQKKLHKRRPFDRHALLTGNEATVTVNKV